MKTYIERLIFQLKNKIVISIILFNIIGLIFMLFSFENLLFFFIVSILIIYNTYFLKYSNKLSLSQISFLKVTITILFTIYIIVNSFIYICYYT